MAYAGGMGLVWDESFSVGVEALDRQHQRILVLISELRSRDKARLSPQDIEDALYALTQYILEHFRLEEALLAKHRYPALSGQVEEHRAFAREVAARCMGFIEKTQQSNPDLLPFLDQWWRHHVLQVDMAYKPFFERLEIC